MKLLRSIDELLKPRLVLVNSTVGGTGFLVAPGAVLTCAHVVDEPIGEIVEVRHLGVVLDAEVESRFPAAAGEDAFYPYPDLCLLRIRDYEQHPCVVLDERIPVIDQRLYTRGYTTTFSPMPSEEPSTFTYEGLHDVAGGQLLKLMAGDAVAGMSGSPLLDLAGGAVAGVVKTSRGERGGGWGIPVRAAFAAMPGLKEANARYGESDPRWGDILRSAGKAHDSRVIVDIDAIRERTPAHRPAGVLFTVTNVAGALVKLVSMGLEVISCRRTAAPHHDLPEGLPEQFSLSVEIEPAPGVYELLDHAHMLQPQETEGYSLQIHAAEGWIYLLSLHVRWREPGGSDLEVWQSPPFELAFTITNPGELLRAAREANPGGTR
ncbi:S1 family peptidase [Nonomuraea rhodomycinica]|uniref:Trypsin-like peptidase domain-containing protein n=1 Tax=Nonomuraea rhodomycinica TaxID=1712872 RepID=A0A7Y6MAL3_9ACTN|nr:serine protease [Nonomuraea rhodomycinica]NUW41343.1 trypsin-like peptidase domain-containing protein [Nonomuraea rhodomycinica]